jgi:hypothetical protein
MQDYTDFLLSGLKYPWPAVAEWAGDAIAKLGRNELVPKLIDVDEMKPERRRAPRPSCRTSRKQPRSRIDGA